MINLLPKKHKMMMTVITAAFSIFLGISSLSQRAPCAGGSLGKMKMQSAIQKKTWGPIFFKSIDRRARLAKLGNLRRSRLSKSMDDMEFRVWIGFGAIPLEGVVIKKSHGQWSALHLRPISPRIAPRDYHISLPSPKSGWEPFWNSLVEKGVLTLPDSSELKEEVLAFDGESFVVEVIVEGSYRTYRYGNPHLQKWPEARKITEIVQSILDEFGIQRNLLKAED